MPDVSIVTVSYNGRDLLRQTLDSVFSVIRGIDFEYIVIDNASQDDSVAMIREYFPQVKLIENKDNIGVAKAYNQGVQNSQGKYIVFLNPDTVLESNIIAGLAQFLEDHPEVGIAGPRVLWPDGQFQLGAGGFASGYLAFWGHYFFLGRLSRGKFPSFWIQQRFFQTKPQQLDWLAAVCMIVRREVFQQVGGFDEKFFVYAEDTELCLRARRAGWGVCYCPQFSIYHYLGGSSKERPEDVPLSVLWLKSLDQLLKQRHCLFKVIILEGIAILGLTARWGIYGFKALYNRDFCRKTQQMQVYIAALWRQLGQNLGFSKNVDPRRPRESDDTMSTDND